MFLRLFLFAPTGYVYEFSEIYLTVWFFRANKKLLERLELHLNNFYLNTVETLIFDSLLPSTAETKPNERIVESILRTTTDAMIRHELRSLQLHSAHRLLLLQLLFRHQDTLVALYLRNWFEQHNDHSPLSTLFGTTKQLSVFFVTCVQEMLVLRAGEKGELNVAKLVAGELRVPVANVIRDQSQVFRVESLSYIARLKFLLKVLAKCVNNQEAMERAEAQSDAFDKVLSCVKELLEPSLSTTKTAFDFLIKELIRKYGNASVKYIMSNEKIKWIGKTYIFKY